MGFSIILLLIEQFIERSAFHYVSFFVQPLPESWDAEQWYAMAHAVPVDSSLPCIVGFVFKDIKVATDFFNLIRAWNYNSDIDKDDNIKLSFIIEKNGDYSTYIYPNPVREIVLQARKNIEEKNKLSKYGKEHTQLIVQVTFCKSFPYGPTSSLRLFKENYTQGSEFEVRAFLFDGINIKEIKSIRPIIKSHVKIKDRKKVGQNEDEYMHGKMYNK